MKVYAEQVDLELNLTLKRCLRQVREHRNFRVCEYINLKTQLLNSYMSKSNLSCCVVAVSGGIDSAIVLALVNYASKQPGSPIKKIVPVCLPATNHSGVTNQMSATDKGIELINALGLDSRVVMMTNAANGIQKEVDTTFGIEASDWAKGQLVPYTRTPTLYYIATIHTDSGFPSVVVGTTNRDEGAYLGYVGKASDGMVDIQLISDLHKSEVYDVAHALDIPKSILSATPHGDMFDGRCDEEVFGAPYDMVELYLGMKDMPQVKVNEIMIKLQTEGLADGSYEQYLTFMTNLQSLHSYNKHKYYIGSPAVHLDIHQSGTEGGWAVDFEAKYRKEMFEVGNVHKRGFVAPIPLDNDIVLSLEKRYYNFMENFKAEENIIDHSTSTSVGNVIKIDNLISDAENTLLYFIHTMNANKQANVHGYLNEMNTENTGSERNSLYNVELADLLWQRVRNHIKAFTCTDHNIFPVEENAIYRAVGINPLFRFIGYNKSGMLIPHYDASFVKNDSVKSLYSLVIYLTDNEDGATRFYREFDGGIGEKNLDDWTYEKALTFNKSATTKNFWSEFLPKKCSALLFPHHMLHDSAEVLGDKKVIMRTDVMFEKIKFS